MSETVIGPQNEIESVMKLFIKTNRLHHNIVENRVKTFGIHHSQHRMLMFLSRKNEPVSQTQIAKELEVSPAAVASILKKLEKEDFICRNCSDKDSRHNEVTLTEKGRSVIIETRRIFSDIDNAMWNGMSHKEITEFSGYLKKLSENLHILESSEK